MYCLFGGLQIAQQPGIQYDEAYLVAGAVHMRHSPTEFPLPHSEFTWMCGARRCLPLMAEIPYVGALKEYLAVPVFALFGPNLTAIRIISLLLGAIGIWGVMRLAHVLAGPLVAAAAGLALAANPAYVDTTIFDNNAFAGMMAGLGLTCAALARYFKFEDIWAAFYVGLAIGFAVWTRANFVWILAGAACATVIVFRLQVLLRPIKHWLALIGGGVLGGLPFLIYQVSSGGGTWQATGMFADNTPLAERLYVRLVLLGETLLADREHRAMWGEAEMNEVERWLPLSIVLAACLICLFVRRPDGTWRFARFCSLAFLLSSIILFTSTMQIAEHHLIAVLPLAVLVVACAGAILQSRFPRMFKTFAIVCLAYAALCLEWQAKTIQGLHETGGVGMWSNAVADLTKQVERDYPKQLVNVVDWGFQDNMYVLSDGRIKSREIFWNADEQRSGTGRLWADELKAGGVFVVSGSENRRRPAAVNGFLKALATANPTSRRATILQRSGLTYAEIIDVEPGTVNAGKLKDESAARISMGDLTAEAKIGGFHKPEASGWRWTKREFFVILDAPKVAGGRPWLQLNLYLPENQIQQQGPMTLSARIGSHVLPPERYDKSGGYTFSRQLEEAWLGAGGNRIDFSLDKVQAPGAGDSRELGIVVADASIKVR